MLFLEKMISPSSGGHLFLSNDEVVVGTPTGLVRCVSKFDARRRIEATVLLEDEFALLRGVEGTEEILLPKVDIVQERMILEERRNVC